MTFTPLLLVLSLLAVGASIVLQSLLLSGYPRTEIKSCECNISTSSTPQTASVSSCHVPNAYRAAAYAHTWFVLGDEFAGGQGASSSTHYVSLLAAQARALTNVDPIVVNAVGDDNADNLPQQVQLVRRSTAYQTLVQSTQSALVIVSYGAGLLQRQADRGTQDAALSIVMEHYTSLYTPDNSSLIPSDKTAQFYVLLVPHPDPTHGGVGVPSECASCPSLNHPTLASRTAHREIYASMQLFLANLATRRGWAWLDTDAALGEYAWPSAPNCESSAFKDCYLYNDLGQSLLAKTLWSCFVE